MRKDLVFVDDIAWSKIEAALSASVRAEHSNAGYSIVHATEPRGLSGAKGWAALVLYDEEQKPIYMVRGGREAEEEFYEELTTNVRVSNNDQNIQPK